MSVASNQTVQRFILAYLNEHPDFLETIKQQFIAPTDEFGIPAVDEETERQIEQALRDFSDGEYITVNPDEDILSALNSFGRQLQLDNVPA